MNTKKVVITSALTFGAMALGTTSASADQVSTPTDKVDAQAQAIMSASSASVKLQAPTYTLMSSDLVSSSDIDDGTGGITDPGDGGTTTDPGDGGTTTDPGDGGTTNDPGDGGTTTDPGDGGTTTDPGDGGTTTDPGNGGSTTNPDTVSDTKTDPVVVQPDNSGNVVTVPEVVQTAPAVAQAVTNYNQALADNNGDSSAQPVVQAKADLDKAIADTLPETGMNKQAGVSVVGVALTALGSVLGLYRFGSRAKLKKIN